MSVEREYMEEARPFVAELIRYIEPEAILFAGDSGVELMAKAHGGRAIGGDRILGPNGTHQATYFREYEFHLPYYRALPAYGIFHPSKLNGQFETEIIPVLQRKLSPLLH